MAKVNLRHSGAVIDQQIDRVLDGSVVVDNTLSEVKADSNKPVSGDAVAKEFAERDTTIAGLQSSVDGKVDNAEFRKESIRLQSQIDDIKPIEITGDVTNAPDEEDITTDANNLLKLKDRPFGKGLGYKILRADKTFAEQVTDPYTIYEVRYDFDLGGEEVELLEGVTLKFNGGSIINGILVGQNSTIADANIYMFNNIKHTGSWTNVYVRPEWFGAKGDGLADDVVALQSAMDFPTASTVILSPKVYRISQPLYARKDGLTVKGCGEDCKILKDFDGHAITNEQGKYASYVTFERFCIYGNNKDGDGVHFEGHYLTSVRLIELFIYNNNGWGAYLSDAYVNRINGGQIASNGNGLYIDKGHATSIVQLAVTDGDIGIQINDSYGVSIISSCIQEFNVGVSVVGSVGVSLVGNYLESVKIGVEGEGSQHISIEGGRITGLGKDVEDSYGVFIKSGDEISVNTVYISSVYSVFKTSIDGYFRVELNNLLGGSITKLISAPNESTHYINHTTRLSGVTSQRPTGVAMGTRFFDEELGVDLVYSYGWKNVMDGKSAHPYSDFTLPADPPSNVNGRGAMFYYYGDDQPRWWNGGRWLYADGMETKRRRGTTAQRENPRGADVGFMYFDTTLGKPIWWDGTKWVDATGTAV